MRRKLLPLVVGALLSAGFTMQASAQEDSSIVTIQPQAEATQAAVIHEGGYIANPVNAADMKHPHPVYAHSRRGQRATTTHQWNEQQAMMYPWHGHYYHYQYGAPLALVVPPTASFQTNYSWGVGNTTSTPIYHQFARPYPGAPTGVPHGLHRTPHWPSNTNQFGVYYIRGPW